MLDSECIRHKEHIELLKSKIGQWEETFFFSEVFPFLRNGEVHIYCRFFLKSGGARNFSPMSAIPTFSKTQLNGAIRRANPEVLSCLEVILWIVESGVDGKTMAATNNGIPGAPAERRDNNTPAEAFTEANERDTTPRKSNVMCKDDSVPNNNKRVLADVEFENDTIVTPQNKEALEDALFDLGYDSDGELPDFGAVDEELAQMQAYNEESAPEKQDEEASTDQAATPPTPVFISIPENVLSKLKVLELREELRKRGVASSGNKPVLLERLKKALEDKRPVIPDTAETAPGQETLSDANFASGAYWRVMDPTTEAVDPTKGKTFYSPTEPANISERLEQAIKRNFDDVFDRPPFCGTTQVPQYQANKRKQIDTTTKEQIYKVEGREKGLPKLEWLKKHNLSHSSRPIDFFDAFVPEEVLDD